MSTSRSSACGGVPVGGPVHYTGPRPSGSPQRDPATFTETASHQAQTSSSLVVQDAAGAEARTGCQGARPTSKTYHPLTVGSARKRPKLGDR